MVPRKPGRGRTTRGALALIVVAAACAGRSAGADSLSAVGGLAFGRNSGRNEIKPPSPMLGVEYALSLSSRLAAGAFYDYEHVRYVDRAPGRVRFRGALLRAQLNENGRSGPFAFVKGGLAQQVLDGETLGNRIAFGAGAGYQLALAESVSLSPRLGVRFLPSSPAASAPVRPVIDTSAMVSFHF